MRRRVASTSSARPPQSKAIQSRSRSFAAVSASSADICCRRASGARSRRPMNRVRTPCFARSGSSRSIVSPKISIRSSTSSAGRAQFSVEKAYSASERTPSSIPASTVRRTARVPARCPSATGKLRCSAQRAFPSRMIAIARAVSVVRAVALELPRGHSNLHDLGLFALQQVVDLGGVLVGQLLDSILGAMLLVSADFAVLRQLLQVVDRVPAHVADGDPPVLGELTDDADELLAPLLGQLRDRQGGGSSPLPRTPGA